MTGQLEPHKLLPSMQQVAPMTTARGLAWGLALLLFAMVVALMWVPWQQNIDGNGRVIALAPLERQQTIAAPVDGRVLRWHVAEGSRVEAGALIVEVSDNDPGMIERLRGELQAAREREESLSGRIAGLEVSRQNALMAAGSRVDMAAERTKGAAQGLEAAEATQVAAKLNIERQQQLHARGLTATRNVELARMENDRAQAEVERARAALNAARKDQEAALAERGKLEADYRAMLDDARASRAAATGATRPIETRLARQTTQEIRAPRDGVILRLLAQPGSEMLKAGAPLAILVPTAASTVVELWVAGNDMPLIQSGDKVRLQFEGWPAVQFVGWPSVAVGTFGGEVKFMDATDDGTGKFRIVVAPDAADEPWPAARYLRQGVRANGWVLLKQVPLGFELWRRFNGFPPTAAQPAEMLTAKEANK